MNKTPYMAIDPTEDPIAIDEPVDPNFVDTSDEDDDEDVDEDEDDDSDDDDDDEDDAVDEE